MRGSAIQFERPATETKQSKANRLGAIRDWTNPEISQNFEMISSLAVLATGIAIVLSLSGIAFANEPPQRLSRSQLLESHDAKTGERKVVRSPQAWQSRRAEITAGMESVTGAYPSQTESGDLAPKIIEEVDAGNYVRRLITYQSEPGSRTPAYLCIPKPLLDGAAKKTAPAVLCLHPTGDRIGHQVVVGLGGRPGRQYAVELTERGYVTIAPAYPLMADYQPGLGVLGYQSGTMKAIWDNSRALDLLESFDFVDHSNGFGAIGHSLGGHNAIFTAVFDPRITVIVSSCGFDSFLDYYDGEKANWVAGKGWCQERYMPRLADYHGRLADIPFDFHELLAALAPRRVFVSAPRLDSNFRWQSVDRCIAAAKPVYRLLGGSDRLSVVHPDCDHNFPEEIRMESYRVIASILKPTTR
jgi:hypothetical protein